MALACLHLAAQPAGYGYGKQISIDAAQVSGPSPLTDFPLLVSFTDPDLRTEANGGHLTSATGYDITFVSAPCSPYTTYDHQIEHYDPATGQYVAWVRVPSLSNSANTDIYMFYGNSGVVGDPSTNTVWNANYRAVYFLDNDFTDQTGNGHHATNNGTVNNAASLAGGGATFGTGDYIQAPTAGISLSAFTVSLWVNSTGFVASPRYILGHTTTPAFNDRIQLYVDDAAGNLDLGLANSHILSTNIFTFSTSTWYRVSLSWDGSNYTVYVNDAQVDAGTYNPAELDALETYLDIGNNGYSATRNEAWAGDIDEVRFYNVEMDPNWLFTEYNNQADPASFYAVTPEYTAAGICDALPIDLKEFEAKETDGRVRLYWATYSEENNALFTIERSADGSEWEGIIERRGAGTSTSLLTYIAYDNEPLPGRSYYRLKQTDYDGAFTYSGNEMIVVEPDGPVVSVYPNPATTELVIESAFEPIESVKIQDVSGVEIKGLDCQNQGRYFKCDVSGLASGAYLLTIRVGTLVTTERVLVR